MAQKVSKEHKQMDSFSKGFWIRGFFVYGPDYIDRIETMVTSTFWINVLSLLKVLWKSSFALERSVILQTPIWFNPTLSLQIRRG